MNMFSEQADGLRKIADKLRNVKLADHESDCGTLFAAMGAMREAADTIEGLRKQVAKCQIAELKADYDTSRYFELFGTPERAARTLHSKTEPICKGCGLWDECIKSSEVEECLIIDHDALLEWLMGDAE